jgi:membrane-associated PAP2 superfamily phosphatase
MNDSFNFIFKQFCYLSIAFALLILFFPIGGKIDLALIQPWINNQGIFYLKHDWFLDTLNHRYAKHVLIACYVFFFLGWLASFKFDRFRSLRWDYGYFFMMGIFTVSMIGIIKSHSSHSCPWDMLMVSNEGIFWNFLRGNGHCFPGGHASSGFGLMVGYFVYRLSNPKRAYFYLFASIILGLGMGWAQIMRGAHFISHNLWTGWITWFLNVVVYMFTYQHFEKDKTQSNFLIAKLSDLKNTFARLFGHGQ